MVYSSGSCQGGKEKDKEKDGMGWLWIGLGETGQRNSQFRSALQLV